MVTEAPLGLGLGATRWTGGVTPPVFRDGACRFCGIASTRLQETVFLDGNPANASPANTVAACPLCSRSQWPDRLFADREFRLIWLPEVSQGALNHLVRSAQLIFFLQGESPTLRLPPRKDTLTLRQAYVTYRSLLALAGEAESRVGTSSPRELAAVLAGHPSRHQPEAASVAASLRMLSLGRLFQDGRDIYPDILTAWTATGAPCADLPFNPRHNGAA